MLGSPGRSVAAPAGLGKAEGAAAPTTREARAGHVVHERSTDPGAPRSPGWDTSKVVVSLLLASGRALDERR